MDEVFTFIFTMIPVGRKKSTDCIVGFSPGRGGRARPYIPAVLAIAHGMLIAVGENGSDRYSVDVDELLLRLRFPPTVVPPYLQGDAPA